MDLIASLPSDITAGTPPPEEEGPTREPVVVRVKEGEGEEEGEGEGEGERKDVEEGRQSKGPQQEETPTKRITRSQ